jgi:5-methylcytosine-specific restriction endonuclease McrA
MVMVEKNAAGLAIRIFRSSHDGFVPGMIVDTMHYTQAVGEIRHQLFVRSNGYCELCGVDVVESTAHMHEQRHRGKGGEISLANSVFICPTCHRGAHAARNPRFSKKVLDKG